MPQAGMQLGAHQALGRRVIAGALHMGLCIYISLVYFLSSTRLTSVQSPEISVDVQLGGHFRGLPPYPQWACHPLQDLGGGNLSTLQRTRIWEHARCSPKAPAPRCT